MEKSMFNGLTEVSNSKWSLEIQWLWQNKKNKRRLKISVEFLITKQNEEVIIISCEKTEWNLIKEVRSKTRMDD